MQNDHGNFDWVREWWAIVIAAITVSGFALLYKLDRIFASRSSLKRMREDVLGKLREHKEANDARLSKIETEIDRVQKLALGAHDMIGRVLHDIELHGRDVAELREYGSKPMREIIEEVRDLKSRIDAVLVHLEVLRGRSIQLPDKDR